MVRGGGAAVFVGAGVGVAVGATVGAAVVGAAVDGLGAAVVGAAVRIWLVGLGDGDADALGETVGDEVAPASRAKPPPSTTPINKSVRRPPATAARMRSTQRAPRRGGGTILVVSDMSSVCRTPHAADAKRSVVCSLDEALRLPLDAERARRTHVAEHR